MQNNQEQNYFYPYVKDKNSLNHFFHSILIFYECFQPYRFNAKFSTVADPIKI